MRRVPTNTRKENRLKLHYAIKIAVYETVARPKDLAVVLK